jgi:hypothetical protein
MSAAARARAPEINALMLDDVDARAKRRRQPIAGRAPRAPCRGRSRPWSPRTIRRSAVKRERQVVDRADHTDAAAMCLVAQQSRDIFLVRRVEMRGRLIEQAAPAASTANTRASRRAVVHRPTASSSGASPKAVTRSRALRGGWRHRPRTCDALSQPLCAKRPSPTTSAAVRLVTPASCASQASRRARSRRGQAREPGRAARRFRPGVVSPASARNSVDLPLPLGPTTAVQWPALISSVKCRRAPCASRNPRSDRGSSASRSTAQSKE